MTHHREEDPSGDTPDIPEQEPSDEEIALELGLPPSLGIGLEPDRKLKEMEAAIMANVERLDSGSGVIHLVEALRDLVRTVAAVQEEQVITRRILYHRTRQQEAIGRLVQEVHRWQSSFGSNAVRLAWIVVTVLVGLLVTQAYESFRDRQPVSIIGPVHVETAPGSAAPPGRPRGSL